MLMMLVGVPRSTATPVVFQVLGVLPLRQDKLVGVVHFIVQREIAAVPS